MSGEIDNRDGLVWRCAKRLIPLRRPLVMGIVNVTPDSFADGGLWRDGNPAAAVAHAMALAEAGADIIDVGGESTRPGAGAVEADEELRRVVPLIEALRQRLSIPLSVDTCKAAVARAALAAGADIINDITALSDGEMLKVAAGSGAGVVLMHMRGTPRTMNSLENYDDVVKEVGAFLAAARARAMAGGVAADAIMIDPGFGFAKNPDQNGELLRNLRYFTTIAPVIAGLSRKRCVGAWSGVPLAAERVAGSVAAAMLAAQRGASVLRVHDVRPTVEALRVCMAIERWEAV